MDEAPMIRLSPDSPKFQLEEENELLMDISISNENNDLKNIDFYTIPQTAFKANEFLVKKYQ